MQTFIDSFLIVRRMRSSIELRVPFANKDIVSYLYNVPWGIYVSQ